MVLLTEIKEWEETQQEIARITLLENHIRRLPQNILHMQTQHNTQAYILHRTPRQSL